MGYDNMRLFSISLTNTEVTLRNNGNRYLGLEPQLITFYTAVKKEAYGLAINDNWREVCNIFSV